MKKILVVDDMAIFREPIAIALQRQGYRATTAADGKTAVATARAERPDLILLDMDMPGMGGLAVLESLRADPQTRDTTVLMLTGDSEREHVLAAARFGIAGYLLKTNFSMALLLRRIEELCLHETPTAPAASSAKPAASAPGEAPQPHNTSAVSAGAPTPVAPASSLRELQPLMNRAEMYKLLGRCGEPKGLSPAVTQILKLTQHKNCDIDDVVKAIKQDHAVSLKILKLANSTAYTRGEPIDSVHKAVARIGLAPLRQMVLNISVVDRFSGIAEDDRINARQFWEHSIATGLIAAEIARRTGGDSDRIEMAFTLGLLHDVGRLVYVELLGERYREVLEQADHLGLPLEQVEIRLLAVNHAQAMGQLLEAWRFSKALIDPVVFHHHPLEQVRRLAPKALNEVALLGLADRLAHAMLLGSSGNPTVYPAEEYFQALALDDSFLTDIERSVPDQAAEIKIALLARSQEEHWPSFKELVHTKLAGPLHPLIASLEPQSDPIALFCRRLADADEAARPNITIVHATDRQEGGRLSELVQQLETPHGGGRWPLMFLMDADNAALDNRVTSGRAVTRLRTPVPLRRFIDACNGVLTPQCDAPLL